MSLLSRYSFSVKPQEAILIVITMFWGGTFLAVQYAVTLSGPFFFVGVRFATAALAVALLSLRTLHKLGRMPGLMPCVGIVLAFIGLIFLAGPGGNLLALGEGEWITLAGAVAIAAEIILISAWAGKVDVRRVTVVQLATASIVAFIAMAPAGETVPPMSTGLLVVALGLGIFSAIIQVTMNWAQRSVSPTRATVIYTGEPVWAGIFGRLAGERLPLLALLGAAFIIVGVLVSELKFKKKKGGVQEAPPESL